MAHYLMIESRDPFESNDVAYFYDLAKDLKGQGNDVSLFLVQNGVLPARPSTQSAALSAVADAGVTVTADDFSLRERGIDAGALAAGVSAAPIGSVIDGMALGHKTLWH